MPTAHNIFGQMHRNDSFQRRNIRENKMFSYYSTSIPMESIIVQILTNKVIDAN